MTCRLLIKWLFVANDVLTLVRCQNPNFIEGVISIFFFHVNGLYFFESVEFSIFLPPHFEHLTKCPFSQLWQYLKPFDGCLALVLLHAGSILNKEAIENSQIFAYRAFIKGISLKTISSIGLCAVVRPSAFWFNSKDGNRQHNCSNFSGPPIYLTYLIQSWRVTMQWISQKPQPQAA